ncbi:hypothetical protein [Nostoc sp. LPT]|uniref:hypothetical protein n=1 Tax=Nostoc sp. LPT TaxID=2815387 RepID=UPI001D41D49E|nr:hypothetical protein [Nostoc sp. LPT]MBN4003571.1 hypothetical protein [Nostoc sp. LPT]
MWFWEKESVEYEVFKKYEGALITIGVNFADAEVQDALEGCSLDLEDALRSAIEYALWLSEHEKEIFPNALLIRALQDNWKPKAWHDEYLEREMFSSPGQRWWNAAEKMWGRDVRNQLVVDVFFDGGGEFIKFSNGKEIRVKTAWVLGWERLLEYASPATVSSIW